MEKSRFMDYAIPLALVLLFYFGSVFVLNNYSFSSSITGFAYVLTSSSFEDNFDDTTGISVQNNVTISGGSVSPNQSSSGEINPASSIGSGLVGLWHLNGGGVDSSGNNFNGTLTGDTTCSSSGQLGNACSFDGTGDAISLPSLSGFNFTSMTVSAWVRRIGVPVQRYEIFHGSISGDTDEMVRLELDNLADLRVDTDFGVTIICNGSSFDIPENTWAHVAYTNDGTTARAYLNGVECNTDSNQTPFSGTLSAQNFIGARRTSSELNFNGSIDEVAVWNRVLSSVEIQQLSQASGGGGGTSGSFESIAINSGSLDQVTATWVESSAGASAVSFTTNNGSTWCTINNGQTLTSSSCLPGSSLKYRVNFSASDNFQNMRLDWQSAPQTDTQNPTVNITSPANNSTVTASVNVTATASDNNAVAGVQFKLDNVNLSAEDTVSPYTISWNTATATNGSHALIAVARDAAGNTATSTTVTVTVSNIAAGVCGNGIIEAAETCDDSDAQSGDGCSSACQIESGFSCVGTPSVCTPTQSGNITANIAPTRTSCVAPCAVWFDASGTTHSQLNTIDTRLNLDYQYNYGDPSSGNWARGALAKNGTPHSKNIDRDTGVVGFHVYEQPGTYIASLNVGGAVASTQITVASPDTQWPGTNTVCVYTTTPPIAGTTTGCPAGASVLQATGANPLSDAILTDCVGSKRCLFQRGESYSTTSPITIPLGSKYFGAYGSGPKPIWQDANPGVNNNFINFGDNLSDFQFVDLDVRGKVDVVNAGSGVAFNASNATVINRALWLRVDITRFDVALYMHCNNFPSCDVANNDVHNQIAFVDSAAQYSPGGQANMSNLANIYITSKYFAMAGSISGDDLAGTVTTNGNSGSSFAGRFKWIDKGYIAHSDWGLINPGPDPMGVAAEIIGCGHEYEPAMGVIGSRGGGILSMRNGLNIGLPGDFPSQDEMFVDNYVSACKYSQTAMVGFAVTDCGIDKVEEWHRYDRMTGNIFSSDTSARLNSSILMVLHGKVQGLLMSNNLFDGTRYTQNNSSSRAIGIVDCDSQTGNASYHPSSDWKVFNNSYVIAASTTNTHSFWGEQLDTGLGSTHATNLKFDNNLYFDADGSGTIPTTFPGMTFCGQSSGPGTCNPRVSTNPFSGTWPFTNINEFRFAGGSSSGINVGQCKTEVPRDALGNARPGTLCDAGAIEFAGTVQPPTNQTPIVNAGTDQNITLSSIANLDATVTDDGLPSTGTLITTWSKLSGAGTVTFGNTSLVDTNATFSAEGTYVLRLTANDSLLSTTDDVTIIVSTQTTTPTSGEVGMNLDAIRSFNSQIVFVDVFKQSGDTGSTPWISTNVGSNTPTSVVIPTDSLGYPLEIPYNSAGNQPQVVSAIMLDTDSPYPTGTYTLIFDGNGQIQFSRNASGTFNQTSGTGTYTFSVPTATNSGIQLTITRSSASNPVKNIRVIMPGYASSYQTQPFYPPFLDKLRGFKILRLMNWIRTNGQLITSWSQRTTLGHVTQTRSQGPAPEYAVMLANELDADPWFTIPHLADDDYVTQLARLIKNSLESQRKVYIEYSNEVWNPQFAQTTHAQNQGVSLGLSTTQTTAGRRFYAKRSAEIFRLFENEFTGESTRLVKVLGGQAGSSSVATEILASFGQSTINGVPVNPTGVSASALAIAPYFGNGLADQIVTNGEVNSITTSQILDRLESTYLSDAVTRMQSNKLVADQFNLPLITYEAGQSVVATGSNANNATLTQKLITANRDQRMYDIYTDYVNEWFNITGGAFVHYMFVRTPSQFGSWGAMEHLGQTNTEAPKYRALLNFITQTPPQAGCTNDLQCSDGLYCNGAERCVAGSCQVGLPIICPNNAVACLVGSCNESTDACVSTLVSCNSDLDNDGVLDPQDYCPNTPANISVNLHGCPLPIFTRFTPSLSTDFFNNDLRQINNLVLGITNRGRITWPGLTNILLNAGNYYDRVNLDLGVDIVQNLATVNPTALPMLDKQANITLNNVNFSNPVIVRDSSTCLDCLITSNSSGSLSFTVNGFSSYSGAEGTCGDQWCMQQIGETCLTCVFDCGACPQEGYCGDAVCNGFESCSSCSADCGECSSTSGSSGTCLEPDSIQPCALAVWNSSTCEWNTANCSAEIVNTSCSIGHTRCFSNYLQECTSENSWENIQDCALGCNPQTIACNSNFECEENWSCSEWSECTNDTQSRECTDISNCGTTLSKPIETQSCGANSLICGDNVCNETESCSSCPNDCACKANLNSLIGLWGVLAAIIAVVIIIFVVIPRFVNYRK